MPPTHRELIALASDRTAFDYKRVEAIRELLLVTDNDRPAAASTAEVLAKLVADRTEDLLVRQIAAQEAASYPCPSEPSVLTSILLDPTEDLDLRVNLLDALKSWRCLPQAQLASSIGANDELRPFLSDIIP